MRRRTKVVLTVIVCVYIITLASVNMADLKVGFDYDDTLSFSTPAFRAGERSGNPYYSPEYWRVVNNSFNLEKKKLVPALQQLIASCSGPR